VSVEKKSDQQHGGGRKREKKAVTGKRGFFAGETGTEKRRACQADLEYPVEDKLGSGIDFWGD